MKCPHFVVSSIEPRVSARHVIRDTPSLITAANSLLKIWDVLNGMATSARDAQEDGGKMLMESANLLVISAQPGVLKPENA